MVSPRRPVRRREYVTEARAAKEDDIDTMRRSKGRPYKVGVHFPGKTKERPAVRVLRMGHGTCVRKGNANE